MASRGRPTRGGRSSGKGGVRISAPSEPSSASSDSGDAISANGGSNGGIDNNGHISNLFKHDEELSPSQDTKGNGKFSGNNLFEALQGLEVEDSEDYEEVEAPKNTGRYNVLKMLERKGMSEAKTPSLGRDVRDSPDDVSPRTKPRKGAANYSGAVGNAGGNYRSSRTWMSPDAQRMQEFLYIRNAMRRLFKHSDIAQWKYGDYIKHREEMLAAQRLKLDREVKVKEAGQGMNAPLLDHKAKTTLQKWLPGPQNLDMQGNFGRVLGEKTIWCHDWQNGKDEISPWPSQLEMKWEGDDRAKTGVGRFLPLPREVGPDGIHWAQLQRLEQYPIDEVARIPTMEDVYLPVDEIPDELLPNFINKDIWKAIEELSSS